MAWYDGIVNGVKKFGSDAAAVGAQVAGMVASAGAGALDGAATLIKDPGKFAEDVGSNVRAAARHMGRSFSDGADMIQDGWRQARESGNPGMFLWKAAGGMAQIASLGASDAFKEHVGEVASRKYDELGNMDGYEISGEADAITRIILENNGKLVSTVVNGDNEINEALAEGDKDKANRVFGQTMDAAVVRPVGEAAKIAAVGVGIAGATLVSGGMATPLAVGLAAGGLGVGGQLAVMKAEQSQAKFDMENVADDAADLSSSMAEIMMAKHGLTAEQAANFSSIMETYYQMAGYTQFGGKAGEAYGFESNEDLKGYLLYGNGYDRGAAKSAESEARLAASVPSYGDAGRELPGTSASASSGRGAFYGDPGPQAPEQAGLEI